MESLGTVSKELRLYEHPFFEFSASEHPDGIEVCIRSKVPDVLAPEFRLVLMERDIEHPQFRWSFQGLLYGCLTDYLVELFTKSPMTRV